MAVTFNKPQGLKYTDMAIYIDEHLSEIKEPYKNPEIEAKIYEYIYHIVYALSCKAGYFKNFDDYDAYSCYAASELYFSMRKKLINAGKEVRGRKVVPIKSALNFIKATMFPLKVNYQRETFAVVFDPQIHSNVECMDTMMRESIQSEYRPKLQESFMQAVKKVPLHIIEVISKTPFRNDLVMCHRLYISCLLTLINDVTLPNKFRQKIQKKTTEANMNKIAEKVLNAYTVNQESAILWHIDENLTNYVRLLVNKIKKKFSKELDYYIHSDDLSDELLDYIIGSAYTNYIDTGDSDI